ncbi:hypothetical protein C0989_005476, partial [Termitomyces sp. Mn162]
SQTPSVPIDLPSNPGSTPIDHAAAYSFASANLPYGLLPEPRQDRPISHNPTPPDSPKSVQVTSHRLSAQAIRAQNVFECSVTSARGSHLPSKDLPSAAEPPRSAEPDRDIWGHQ